MVLQAFRRLIFGALSGLLVIFFAMPASAQRGMGKGSVPESTTPQLHYEFPFQMMWDDAVLRGRETGKPALAFNLDLVDSNSIRLAQAVIADKGLQSYIRQHFEPAMNDFAIDPPVSVGLDSLRNLGQRLSGLEKNYIVPMRPTILVIAPDATEMDRIVLPQNLTPKELETRLDDILHDRNTLHSVSAQFWQDTTSIELRQKLVNMFEERSKYDSVLKHLEVLAHMQQYPEVSRAALARYSHLRLNIEGNVAPMELFMSMLGRHGQDSVQYLEGLESIRDLYARKKKQDSVSAYYERIMQFTGVREPDLLNDYAWHLANFTKNREFALKIANEAIQKNPNDANYYDTRALIHALLVDLDDAMSDEKKALSLAQDDEQRAEFQDRIQYYTKLKTDAQETLRKEAAEKAGTKSTTEQPSIKKVVKRSGK